MTYDQRLKELLRTFFYEFLLLFFPQFAEVIDPESIVSQDPEVFTDLPEGQQRIADLVMGVRSLVDIPDAVLFHTEVQARQQEIFGWRMWQYNALLRLRRRLPTISIAVTLFPGTGGITREIYTETRLSHRATLGEYWQVGLRDLNADDYVDAEPELVVALAALMQPGPAGRAALKIALLRRLRASSLDEARLFLLVNTVETYLVLNRREEAEMRAQLRAEGDETVETTELTWMDRLLEQGRSQGIEQGLAQGVEQGRSQGIEQGALTAKRQIISMQAQTRYGRVPPALETRLAAADDAMLDRILLQIVQAATLDEFLASI